MRLFPDSVKRLNRAVVHYNAAYAEILKFVQPEAHDVVVEINDAGTEGVAKTRLPEPPDNDVALELGEFFYQLRAALDSLIYQTSVYTEGVDPPSNKNKAEFPICIDKGKFNQNAVNKLPFPPQLRDWLLSIQPYVARDASNNYHMLSQYLEILHDCARIDRHRRLHLVGIASFNVDVEFETSPEITVSSIERVNGNILESEAIFLRFRIEGMRPGKEYKIKLKSKFQLEITLENLPVPSGGNMGRELVRIMNAVDQVIKVFKDCYGGDTNE